jgi:hypothetical protein
MKSNGLLSEILELDCSYCACEPGWAATDAWASFEVFSFHQVSYAARPDASFGSGGGTD